jgi:hypothetical protein
MDLFMIRVLALGLICLFPVLAFAFGDNPKYQRGDCITPVEKSYSWYGKYASVEAYSVIEGFSKTKSYILAFPLTGSNSVIFNKTIETATEKVEPMLCGK